MILMPQIFDVIANQNARYKRNELELCIYYFGVTSIFRGRITCVFLHICLTASSKNKFIYEHAHKETSLVLTF